MNAITVAITIIILYAGYKINWKKVWYNHEEFFKVIFIVALIGSAITGIGWAVEKDAKNSCLKWGEEKSLGVEYQSSFSSGSMCWVIIKNPKKDGQKKVSKATYEEMKALKLMEEDGL